MSTGTTDATGVILAGGRSSRMGRDKALLIWQGRPLIEHMLGLLRDAGITRVHVSGERPDYHGIPDQQPGSGPIGGLHSVAEGVEDGELLVLPVDMPRLQGALLRRLLQAPDAACVCFEGHALPMRLRLDRRSREALRTVAAAEGRSRSIRALQQQLGATCLALPPGQRAALDNCNTPQDWDEACRS